MEGEVFDDQLAGEDSNAHACMTDETSEELVDLIALLEMKVVEVTEGHEPELERQLWRYHCRDSATCRASDVILQSFGCR